LSAASAADRGDAEATKHRCAMIVHREQLVVCVVRGLGLCLYLIEQDIVWSTRGYKRSSFKLFEFFHNTYDITATQN